MGAKVDMKAAVGAWQKFHESTAALEGWAVATPPPITPKEAASLKRLVVALDKMAGGTTDPIEEALLPFLRAVYLGRKRALWWCCRSTMPSWMYSNLGSIICDIQANLKPAQKRRVKVDKILRL